MTDQAVGIDVGGNAPEKRRRELVNRHFFRYPVGEPVPILLSRMPDHAGVPGAAAIGWESLS